MTLKDTVAQLESLGNEQVHAQIRKAGAEEAAFGQQFWKEIEMERRAFLTAAVAGAGVLGSASSALGQTQNESEVQDMREYYELRTYVLKDKAQQALVEDYLEKALIPALNRMGIQSVGVFTEMEPSQEPKLYVLIVYPSLDVFSMLQRSDLHEDETLQKDGAAYLRTPVDAPAYQRIHSSLMIAFRGMPQVKVPEKKSRVFELREYQSHNETKAKKKIEMFDSAEIALFIEKGLTPVFFGETLVGGNIPNLTYMVVFDDMEDQGRDWKSFAESPEWNELKSKAEYADTVSNITKTFLVPTAYSQI